MIATTPPGGRLPPTPEPSPPGYAPPHDAPASSNGTLEVLSGDTAVSLWVSHETADTDSGARVQLQLEPDRSVVIGRQEGGLPPYLDPSYRTTRVVPGTGQAVAQSSHEGRDVCVSRGHFTLRGDARGIVLTNGVPRVGGGIRPPMNGTRMLEPDWRRMDPGKEYLIEHGAKVVLHLPNGTVVQICAA
jgi:hypothetical protein